MAIPNDDDHRALFLRLTPEEFGLWKNNPLTRAYFKFLTDQRDNWRGVAMEMLEAGQFDPASPHEDRNPHVVRGKLACLNGLRELSLADIQSFYREESGEEA